MLHELFCTNHLLILSCNVYIYNLYGNVLGNSSFIFQVIFQYLNEKTKSASTLYIYISFRDMSGNLPMTALKNGHFATLNL